jgi:hypothetical protein
MAASIERYLLISLYFMVVAGFLTLASTGELDPPSLVLIGAAVLYRGYLLATRRSVPPVLELDHLPGRWYSQCSFSSIS